MEAKFLIKRENGNTKLSIVANDNIESEELNINKLTQYIFA